MFVSAHGHEAPAGGAPLQDVAVASVVAALGLVALAVVTIVYRRGGLKPLRAAATFASSLSGLPQWAALPAGVLGASLLTAVFGFYWDVATHIDNGRDPGPFANPAHFFILAGLAGIALAGWLAALLGDRDETSASAVRPRGWIVPIGGLLILICGVVALAGFPLDDVWHRLFGQDVTLWGPTHIQMVGGASLSTLGFWILLREGGRTRGGETEGRSWLVASEALIAGAFLVGLSTLQGEFDFGVPQFRLLYHPVLLMLAASIGLAAARLKLGRGGALKAVVVFIVLRALLTLLVGPVLGRITLHFPLYLVEAVIVELVGARVPSTRPLRFALAAGAGIGTVGLASEWAWSHLWMPIAWPAELLPEGAVLGLAAAVGGSLIGATIGTSLAGSARTIPRGLGAAAVVVVVLCLAIPAPMGPPGDVRAQVELSDVTSSPEGRRAVVTARLSPPDIAADALWFQGLAWQGLNWDRGSSALVPLEEVTDGVYQTTSAIPVGGDYKSLLRLHVDDRLLALPLYLPADSAIPAEEVPAPARFERAFVADKEIVQREAITTSTTLQRVAYGILIGLGALWLATFGWGLARLSGAHSARPSRPTSWPSPAIGGPQPGRHS